MSIDNASILVTGGSGSFGRAFVSHVLGRPKRIVIYSRGEHLQEQMQRELNGHPSLRFYIGDIRDYSRLEMAMKDIDIVVHAAAMKVVPKCEIDPIEAVATNVLGAENVIRAAIRCGVKKVIALSTDKAVAPVNLYGATKLCAEKLFVAARNLVGAGPTRFSVCRYGNVWGSQGSVVPLFKSLTEAGAKTLPITDRNMTRFIITMPEAVEFVLRAISEMEGQEIFVPKIPSAYVTDIAEAINPEATWKIIGVRPGEKLHEDLITGHESRYVSDYGWAYVIQPLGSVSTEFEAWSYCSNTNESWLSMEKLRAIL